MDFKGKRVVFITTKNLDYLRNVQEIELIKQSCKSCKVIGSSSKSYPKRLLKVYTELFRLRKNSFDTAFAGFAPQLVIPLFSRKFKGKTLVIDFFISMYDTLCLDRRKFKPDSVFGKILKRIDSRTLKRADRIITDTKAHADFFVNELGAERKKVETLYLNADTSIYYPRERKGSDRRFTVLYFGSILPLQGIDVILKAVGKLGGNSDMRFIIVGPVDDKINKPTGSNIEYYNWLSQPELADKIAESDLCLAGHFNASIGKAKRTIPGKAYIYRAMNKPMILGDNPATHELYSEGDEGIWFVKMGDPDALAQLILKIKKENSLHEENN